MAASTTEEYGFESQSSFIECVPSSQHYPCSDSLPEWRSSEQVGNGTPSTSPPYWDTDGDDNSGPRPSDLFGKHTWRIDNFSQIKERELRSDIFEIGGYEWYILIYPQGCDVCNHLSLFLCVANHDKLLPGWSHFAQFTIAVVNKDIKKAKYSDTLHRFWKKEHDWGWKKFIELSKISDGFLVDDALVIKAQVQVIREKTDRPFRCLDWEYRRELVRLYLSNVEQLCRRFVEEKRGKFSKMLEDKVRWSSFHAFWLGVDQNSRQQMSRDKSEMILKGVIKHFFIENEVTSTLVMDYLYSGLKVLECQSQSKKGRAKLLEMEETPAPFIHVEKDIFVLTDDVLLLLQRSASEPLPPKDEKGSQNQNRIKIEGNCGEELSKDSVERDERLLTELGRRTVEISALNHFLSRIEVAYQEAVALRRQEELIREEEAAGQTENEVKSKRSAVEKEKRTKKKQTKQKKGSHKGKDRGRDEKQDTAVQKSQMGNNSREGVLEDIKENFTSSVLEETKISADVSDSSDIGDGIAETPQLNLEERNISPVSWDMDASEIHPPVDSELQKERTDKRTPYVMDDSSSTCSTDSVPSIVMNGSSTTNASSNRRNSRSRNRGKNQGNRCTSNQNDPAHGDTDKLQADSIVDITRLCDSTGSCRGTAPESEAVLLLNNQMQQLARHLKEEVQKKTSKYDQVDLDGPLRSMGAEQSSPSSPIKSPSICQQSKQTSERGIIAAASVAVESSSNDSCLTEKLVPTVTSSPLILKQVAKSTVGTRINVANQASVESRPLSGPLAPAPRPVTSTTSTALSAALLSRSVSASGRLGVDPSSTQSSTVPHSYRNAIMSSKSTVGVNTHSLGPPSSSCSSSPTFSFSGSSPSVTLSAVQRCAIVDKSAGRQRLTFGSVNPEALQSQCLWKEERLEGEATRSKVNSYNLACDDVRPYFGGSCHRPHCLDDVPSGLSFHQTQGLGAAQDEFPHLDIINDLLNEEQSVGGVAENGYYHHDHHRTLSEQYMFADDASTAAVDIMSNGGWPFDQVDLYYHDRIQTAYGCSGGPLEGRRTLTSAPLDDLSAYYVSGQNGGMIQNQWPLLGMPDCSVGRLASSEANGYAFHLPDYLKFGLWVERI